MIAPPRKMTGFTLVELLLVLVVLALVASLAIPSWFDGTGRTLANATRLLAHDLREAQNRAAFYGRGTRMVFRSDGDGYWIENDQGGPEAAPLGGGEYQRTYSFDGIFRGVQIKRVDLGGDRMVTFDKHGIADADGMLLVTFGDDSLLVRIEAGSGLIEIDGLDWTD
ncbi:MAG: prepilin-type N-terminal cleavage/methylation domain-containing protein [Chlamydiales bacterium]|jgi:prepilin-type N-terminal cleavage/methylation domain-containing protein